MAKKKRYIEVVSPVIRMAPHNDRSINFFDILTFINRMDYRYGEKLFEINLINSSNSNCIIGIIITTQDKDIPPIRDKNTRQYQQVNIDPETQGLAFGNIFLYDISKNILLYEINRNGCFLNQLKSFIYSKWNTENEYNRFDIVFSSVVRQNEYQRLLNMDYFKRFTLDLYSPMELLNCIPDSSDSVENNLLKHQILAGIQNNADALRIEQFAYQKRFNPSGLNKNSVISFVDAVKMAIFNTGHRRNVKSFTIYGYSSDCEDSKAIKPINLLADTFNEYFKISDIQIQSDVQQNERRDGILNLYNKLLPELTQLSH